MDTKEFEVNIDRGIVRDGKHYPLGARLELEASDAAPLVKVGHLVEVPPSEATTAKFMSAEKKE